MKNEENMLMKVKLPRKALAALAKAVSSVAKTSDIRPVLRNVLLAATSDGFELTATDLVTGFWLTIKKEDGAEVLEEGVGLVSAQSLQRVMDALSSESVLLEMEDLMLVITADKAKFKLVTEDHKDFPGISRFSPRLGFATVKAKAVTNLISRVAFCAHSERSHYNMHGILIKETDGIIEMAATNGQRLSVANAPVAGPITDDGKDRELIIPAASINAIKKVVSGGADETLDLQWKSRTLNVRGSRGEVFLLALNGRYPPYARGIPNTTKEVELNRRLLIELMKQATALRSSTSAFVDLTFEDGRLVMQSNVQDSGSAKLECAIEWGHDPLTIVINPDFITQTASAMAGDSIVMEIEDVNTPTLLKEKPGGIVDSLCVFAVARR